VTPTRGLAFGETERRRDVTTARTTEGRVPVSARPGPIAPGLDATRVDFVVTEVTVVGHVRGRLPRGWLDVAAGPAKSLRSRLRSPRWPGVVRNGADTGRFGVEGSRARYDAGSSGRYNADSPGRYNAGSSSPSNSVGVIRDSRIALPVTAVVIPASPARTASQIGT